MLKKVPLLSTELEQESYNGHVLKSQLGFEKGEELYTIGKIEIRMWIRSPFFGHRGRTLTKRRKGSTRVKSVLCIIPHRAAPSSDINGLKIKIKKMWIVRGPMVLIPRTMNFHDYHCLCW